MLCLSRKLGEVVLIGDNIRITIVRVGPNSVRIGVDAPKGMTINRQEVEAAIAAELSEAQDGDEDIQG